MEFIAEYNGELGVFNFDTKRLIKAGIELNILRGDIIDNPASQLTLDLIIIKALKDYFGKEKIISFDAIDCYMGALKKSFKLTETIKQNNYFLPFPINLNRFSQEQILGFYENETFNPLLGMMVFVQEKYKKKFKNKE